MGTLTVVMIIVASAATWFRRNQLNSELVQAVYLKETIDANRVRALLAEGADPNVIGPKGVEALTWAAMRRSVEPLRLLLDAGANPNGRYGQAPALNGAVRGRNAEAVKLLLSRGANPNNGGNGSDALLIAVENKDPVVTQVLLAHGAAANSTDENGTTALVLARRWRAAAVAKQLRQAGATE